MKIFISWSGPESQAIAETLRDWLPCVLQAAKPWMSKEDIRKGGRGGQAIGEALRDAKAGIICVTPANLDSPWLNFEAGAISKMLDEAPVCTFLHGLKPSEVKPPLSQFQHTEGIAKADVLRMLGSINKVLGDQALAEATLEKTFNQWWPELEEKTKKAPAQPGAMPRRTVEEMSKSCLVWRETRHADPARGCFDGVSRSRTLRRCSTWASSTETVWPSCAHLPVSFGRISHNFRVHRWCSITT